MTQSNISSNALYMPPTYMSGQTVYAYGGGLYLEGGSANISTSIFAYNTITSSSPGSSAIAGSYYSAGAAIYAANLNLILKNTTFLGNRVLADYSAVGGAIYGNGATSITAINCRFHSNTAWSKATAAGGALSIDGSASSVTRLVLRNVTLVNNTAEAVGSTSLSASGGAAMVSSHLVTMTGVVMRGNKALTRATSGINPTVLYGGGLCAHAMSASASLQIARSNFSNNMASASCLSTSSLANVAGGAIYVKTYGLVSINNTQVSSNTARLTGRTSNSSRIMGGGIYHTESTVRATSLVLRNNRATGVVSWGGGWASSAARLVLTGSKVASNLAEGHLSAAGGGIYCSITTKTSDGLEIRSSALM
jgi:hypothetical protein